MVPSSPLDSDKRLGLARANLRRNRFLLLDEATSALDENTERQVLENLSASGQAILIVTHRASAQTFAHRVFRLGEGTLIEENNFGNPVLSTRHSMNAKESSDEALVEFH
jgi:ABC-type transport system involved in cytochrome bd biosynthesis fused ATPase/permease subunit